jgi:hypothetical protein
MPLADRDYIRGSHPPSCTCTECVNRRLGIYKKSKRVRHKPYRVASYIILSLVLIFILGLIGGGIYGVSKYGGDAWHWITQEFTIIQDKAGDIVSSITADVSPAIESGGEAVVDWAVGSTSLEDYENIFNQYRQENGLAPLVFTDDLNRIAALRLEELKVRFSHDSQYNKYLGENIVTGIANNQGALSCWQDSPLHNANILDADYKNTGYAIGGGYAVQVFSKWTTINGIPQLPKGWYFPD